MRLIAERCKWVNGKASIFTLDADRWFFCHFIFEEGLFCEKSLCLLVGIARCFDSEEPIKSFSARWRNLPIALK